MSTEKKPLDQMTNQEKAAAGFRPVRCSACRGSGMRWIAKLRRSEKCPECHGAKFFWLPPAKTRSVDD